MKHNNACHPITTLKLGSHFKCITPCTSDSQEVIFLKCVHGLFFGFSSLPPCAKSTLIKFDSRDEEPLIWFLFYHISQELSIDPDKLRSDLEHQLSVWSNLNHGTAEEQRLAQSAWHKYEVLTSSLAQELCEQLRLVLEPSLATKLKWVWFEFRWRVMTDKNEIKDNKIDNVSLKK